MIQEVYIIDDKRELIENLKLAFKNDKEYKFKTVGTDNLEEASGSGRSLNSALILRVPGT